MKKIILACMLAMIGAAHADEAGIRKSMEAAYPGVSIKSITKTNYAGLYEVYLDGQIVYTDDKFSFLIAEGRLIDPKTKRNVTEERLEDLTRVDFSKLPLDKAVKVVRGNGSKKVVVFSDPDCPFCKRLEQNELTKINDITVYTFLMPLEKLHPDAATKSKAIWCSSDRGKAWMDWVLKNDLVQNDGKCDVPLAMVADMAAKLGVSSTPTMIFADGRRINGAYPAKEIEKAIARAQGKK